MDSLDRLTDVFRTVFNNESLTLHDSMTADDIDEWDSVQHVTLIFAVEEEFGITFTTSDLKNLGSVGDLRMAVEKRLANR